MTDEVKQELIEYLAKHCRKIPKMGMVEEYYCYPIAEVAQAIGMFKPKPTEGCTCGTENELLQKKLDYWKSAHQSMREENIKLEAIIRTIEQVTGKNFLG